MRRGTTPVHVFEVPLDLREATIYITYQQDGQTVVEKTGDDLQVDEGRIICRLTQAETLRFSTGGAHAVRVQMRYVLPDGTADASQVISVPVGEILKEGEI